MRILCLGLTLALLLLVSAQAADISGRWLFSVDLTDGGHGAPTFILKQTAGKLTGTYNGPLGEKQISGTVTGNAATFRFSMERDGVTTKVTYTAKIDAPTKMSGTVTFESSSGDGSGKWTAVKQ